MEEIGYVQKDKFLEEITLDMKGNNSEQSKQLKKTSNMLFNVKAEPGVNQEGELTFNGLTRN